MVHPAVYASARRQIAAVLLSRASRRISFRRPAMDRTSRHGGAALRRWLRRQPQVRSGNAHVAL